eukprot:42962-Pleurochrysis_carterae.AAC.1
MVLIDSLRRRTTEQIFSAINASPSCACAGNERFRQTKAWCRALNSVTDASARPLSRRESIMDSRTRPAEGEDALASATRMRISDRPLF